MNADVLSALAKLLEVIGDQPLDLTVTLGGATIRLTVTRPRQSNLMLPPGATMRHVRVIDNADGTTTVQPDPG